MPTSHKLLLSASDVEAPPEPGLPQHGPGAGVLPVVS